MWLDLLCIMHDSPRRGVLLLPTGEPMPIEEIARNLGETKTKTIRFLNKIAQRGVSSSEEKTGALFSRRMVRDEYISQQRKECGGLGGNPALLNQNPSKTLAKPKQTSNQKPTPSSSSSSSREENKGTTPSARRVDPAANAFADAYMLCKKNPYGWASGDFPQLARLRNRLNLGTNETPKNWDEALVNYFASPFSEYSLQHFASKFDTFKDSSLDRFKVPTGNGTPKARGLVL